VKRLRIIYIKHYVIINKNYSSFNSSINVIHSDDVACHELKWTHKNVWWKFRKLNKQFARRALSESFHCQVYYRFDFILFAVRQWVDAFNWIKNFCLKNFIVTKDSHYRRFIDNASATVTKKKWKHERNKKSIKMNAKAKQKIF
jgi:hypothetical protein